MLQALDTAPEGLTLREITAQVGRHANTVRFHLQRLEHDRLVRRALMEPTVGRPPIRYIGMPRPRSNADRRDYYSLARALASVVATRVPRDVALEAGRDWAQSFFDAPQDAQHSQGPGVEESVNAVAAVMNQVGFDPRITGTRANPRLIQQHCPFLELAEEHRDVVCTVHLGLIRGVLEHLHAPLVAERLVPFATPDGCLVELRQVG